MTASRWNGRAEEAKERRADAAKKRESQQKWKETWEAEMSIRRLRASAERGSTLLHEGGYARYALSPSARSKKPQDSAKTSRGGGFFVTSGAEEMNDGYKSGRSYGKKEMWANRAFQ